MHLRVAYTTVLGVQAVTNQHATSITICIRKLLIITGKTCYQPCQLCMDTMTDQVSVSGMSSAVQLV